MKLLYFWLGKSKSEKPLFENFGLNLSNEYTIKYNQELNKLFIDNNPNYVKKFYNLKDNDLITEQIKNNSEIAEINLKCIVGKNGSGKTILLEIIQGILIAPKYLSSYFYNYIVLYENENENKYKGIIYCNKKIDKATFEIINNTKNNLKPFSDDSVPQPQEDINVIHYNPFMCNNRYEINDKLHRLYDIRTFNLIEVASKNFRENRVEGNSDKLEDFRMMELKRNIFFYIDEKNKKFLDEYFPNNHLNRWFLTIEPINPDFDLHKRKLSSNFNVISNEHSLVSKLAVESLLDRSKEFLIAKFNHDFKAKSYISTILWKITAQMWLLFIDYLGSWLQFSNGNADVLEKIEKWNFENNNQIDFITKTLDLFPKLFVRSDFNCNHQIETIRDTFISFIDLVSEMGNSDLVYGNKIFIRLDDSNKNNISELIKIYADSMQLLIFGEYVRFGFEPRFSSGEQSLITLFSRLYNTIALLEDGRKDIQSNVNSLMILLDEGETAYHPQWEKCYIYAILSYIQYLQYTFAKNIKDLQVIVTTNSPMILSDIIHQDVIYLIDNDNKRKNIPESAFGSNILDLYSDSFFIDDGLIGAFAKKKIKQVIKFIKSNSQDNKELSDNEQDEEVITKEECEFIINNIGDSNIKAYLHGLFKEKICKKGL